MCEEITGNHRSVKSLSEPPLYFPPVGGKAKRSIGGAATSERLKCLLCLEIAELGACADQEEIYFNFCEKIQSKQGF